MAPGDVREISSGGSEAGDVATNMSASRSCPHRWIGRYRTHRYRSAGPLYERDALALIYVDVKKIGRIPEGGG